MNSYPVSIAKWHGGFLAIVLGLLSINSANAQVIWYNGDYDHQSGLVSTDSPSVPTDGIVYDDFNVTSATGWNIESIFGTFLFTAAATSTSATWEIRSGVSVGNGGTIVASGFGPAVVTQIGTDRGYNIEHIEISGLHFALAPGTYWVGMEPTTPAGYGYLVTTSGANAIGTPAGNDSNAFFTSTDFDVFFVDTVPLDGHDFSLGLTGVAAPEPSVWMLLLGGCAALGLWRRWHRLS